MDYPKLDDGSPDFEALRRARDAEIDKCRQALEAEFGEGCVRHFNCGNHTASCYCNCEQYHDPDRADIDVRLCEHEFDVSRAMGDGRGRDAVGYSGWLDCSRCGLSNWVHDEWLF